VLINNVFKADAFSKILISLQSKDKVKSIEINRNEFKSISNISTDLTGEHINTIMSEFVNLNKLYFISSSFSIDAITTFVSKIISNTSNLNFI